MQTEKSTPAAENTSRLSLSQMRAETVECQMFVADDDVVVVSWYMFVRKGGVVTWSPWR